ncbi:MAG TPA: hypothetical protein VH762_01760 [Gemmatimonadaceae bacterium]|jgi:hypothetical protein
MLLSIRRWRPRHLLLSWLSYWLLLAGVTLGPAVAAIMRATGPDAKGSLNASAGDKGLSLTVIADGGTTWSGTASLTSIAFWVVGPPLLLWLVWFVRRKPRDEPPTAPSGLSAPNAKALSEGEAQRVDAQRQRDPASRV